MPTLIERRDFAGRDFTVVGVGYRIPDLVEDVEVTRCSFDSLQHPAQRTLWNRPTLRNVCVTRCHFSVCEFGPVVAEDCTLDTVWFHRGKWGQQLIMGSALKHVVVRGNITGAVAVVPSREYWTRHLGSSALDDPFVVANRRYYESVDWALDISGARFTGLDMHRCDIPARLIRRDPETQVVMTREMALSDRWREPMGDMYWRIGVERFLQTGFEDTVFVAGRLNRRFFAEEMAAIRRLRSAGVVLPD